MMRHCFSFVIALLLSIPAFSQSVSFNQIQLPHGMQVAGDFNSDGREDGIVFGGTNSFHSFNIYKSTGTGTYSDGPSYTFPNGEAYAGHAVADFTNDGKLDVVILTYASKLYFYKGNGDGTFQAPITTSLPFMPGGIQRGDVNHDGKMDLVLVKDAQNPATLVSYFGNGSGGFTAGPVSNFDNNYAINGIGDFDGDGKADVFTANCDPGGCGLTVYFGDGTGRFGSPTTASANQGRFTVADVDGDGKSDILAADEVYQHPELYQHLTVYYGAADRTLQAVTIPTAECTYGSPVAADFNGDHIPDIIFAERNCNDQNGSSQMVFIPGQGNRTFGPEQPIFNSLSVQRAGDDTIVLRANNSDTKPDFFFTQSDPVSLSNPGQAFVMVNQTTGTFAGCNAPNSGTGFRICSPTSGSTVSSPVRFSIGAAGGVPMRKVEVWADGAKQAEQLYGFSHYAFLDTNLNLSPGSHSITVFSAGWDNSLQSKTYNIAVAGGGGGGCTSGNSITVCQPAANSTVSSPVQIQASTTLGSPTYRFELWNGSTKLFSVANGNTMNTSVSLTPGTHKLAFVARTSTGIRKELDITVTVK